LLASENGDVYFGICFCHFLLWSMLQKFVFGVEMLINFIEASTYCIHKMCLLKLGWRLRLLKMWLLCLVLAILLLLANSSILSRTSRWIIHVQTGVNWLRLAAMDANVNNNKYSLKP